MHDGYGVHQAAVPAAIPAAPASSNTSAPAAGGQAQPLRDICALPDPSRGPADCLDVWVWLAACVWRWFAVCDCGCGLLCVCVWLWLASVIVAVVCCVCVAMARCLGLWLWFAEGVDVTAPASPSRQINLAGMSEAEQMAHLLKVAPQGCLGSEPGALNTLTSTQLLQYFGLHTGRSPSGH